MYLQIVPIKLRNGRKTVITNALLDSGKDSVLIREDTAKNIDFHGTTRNLQMTNAFIKLKDIRIKAFQFLNIVKRPYKKHENN